MISIDITKDAIYAVSGSKKSNKLVVRKAKYLELKKPILTSDEEINVDELINALREVTEGMREKDVAITLSSSTVVSSEYTLPYEKKVSNMSNILWGEVSQTLLEKTHILDYKILDIYTEGKNQTCRLNAYIAKRSTVMAVENAIKQIGKNPVCYNIVGNCINNLISFFYGNSPMMIASLFSDQLKMHLFVPPNSTLTRTAILKVEEDLSALGLETPSVDDEYDNQASDQISKMLQFAAIKYPGTPINNVYISGELATDEVADYLSTDLSNEITLLPQPRNLIAPQSVSIDKFAYVLGGLL